MNTRMSYLERSISVVVIALLITPLNFVSLAEATQKNDENARAQQIIEKAREAIFGSLQIGDIRGLSLTRKNRIHYRLGGIQQTGESNVDLLLPDKMMIREAFDSIGDSGQTTYYRVLNGNQSWKYVHSSSG